ncbi:MAG: thioredoxin family protein [Planctomycetota bacterium]
MLARLAPPLFLCLTLGAQQPTPPTNPAPVAVPDRPTLSERLADKLAQPFLRLAPWHTSLDAAKRAAAADGKLIFVHCTRSFTPCGTSIACERGVLSSAEFREFSRRVVLHCHVTSHLDAEADRFLAATRGSGWPHHVVMDAGGRVLGVHESHRDKSVVEFTGMLLAAEEFVALEAESARAIATIQRNRLEAGLRIGALDLATARSLFTECGTLEPADVERLAAAITDLEVAAILARVDRFDPAVRPVVGAEFQTMWRAGKRPSSRNAARDFWAGILLHQETLERPDLELYAEGLAKLTDSFGELRGYRSFLEERRQKLAAMQASAPTPAPAPAPIPTSSK